MDFLYWAWEGYPVWAWAGFAVFILCMLALDLGVLNRNAHVITYREAATWSAVWVTLALIFAALVFWREGRLTGVEFLTGYIIELSLSVDNLFVFLLIFGYFKVPAKYQHRVLFWGVMGALVMRMTMIALGAALIERFHWIIYVFGVFLIYTGIKMMRQDRKSTRLNSSHANISYAVFCLKANISSSPPTIPCRPWSATYHLPATPTRSASRPPYTPSPHPHTVLATDSTPSLHLPDGSTTL